MKQLLFIFLFSLSSHLSANTELEWQRIELEKLIDGHYSHALGKLLERADYHVKSKVSYNDPGMPRFDDLNEADLKVSDVEFDDSKGDYIAFSKVGLEVPVIENFYRENQRRLKELYRHNESYSLFKNIESIDLKVVFSDKLDPQLVEAAKKVVEANRFDVANMATKIAYSVQEIKYEKPIIPPEAQADKAKEEEKEIPKEDPFSAEKLMELLGRFGNAIGMIAATTILGILGYIILRKYMQLLKELQEAKQAAERPNNEVTEEKSQEDDQADELADIEQLISENDFSHFDKIESFLKSNQDAAILMIKRWINDSSENHNLALAGLAQQLEHSFLEGLQKKLSFMEREAWSLQIQSYLGAEQVLNANKIILKEIVREVVTGQKVNDYELIDTLLTLEPEVASGFIREYPKDGGVLLNLLSPSFAGKILERMDDEEVSRVVKLGLEAGIPNDATELSKFKKLLIDYKAQAALKPFNYKILQMLPEVTPEKEKVLYDFLASNNQLDKMIANAKKMIPSELVLSLPAHIMKTLMQNYPLKQKVNLLLALPEEKRSSLLDTIAESGSAARDMLDMEMENAQADELNMARLKRENDSIWKGFVAYCRQVLSETSDFEQEVHALVEEWAAGKAKNAA